MRTIVTIAASLMLVAGCSGPESEDSATKEGGSSDTADATGAVDYDVPKAEPGVFWFYKSGEEQASVVYGPPQAGGYVMLLCDDDAVEIILPDVDGLSGRETATLRSGPLSEDFKSGFDDEGMGVLFFSVPKEKPILQRFVRDGFYIDFPNGEQNPFPPDGKIELFLNDCAG